MRQLIAQRGVFEQPEPIPLLVANSFRNHAVQVLVPVGVLLDKTISSRLVS